MTAQYQADEQRYQQQAYRRCGRSGLQLPAIALGLWHNFGAQSDRATCRALLRRAFDLGITHFDLANNYGPPPAVPSRPSANCCSRIFCPIAMSSSSPARPAM